MGGGEEIDIELRLSCSAVKEKSRYNCPLNLFSCSETTIGDAESLNMGAAYMFSSPEVSDLIQAPKKKAAKEFREQDLLRRLVDGSRSSCSSEEENSVTSCSAVDCTLSLGMSNTILFSEQQGEFKGLLMSSDRSPLPAVVGDEDFSWMKLQDMLRRRRIEERRLHIEGTPSRSCISPKITNGDRESSYNTMAVPFSELRSTNNNIHGSQLYKSCWNTTATSSNTTSWLLDSRQKPMGSKNILPSRNHPPCGAVFRSQVSPRIPTNNTSSTNYINNSYGGNSRVVQQQQKQKRNATSQDAKGNFMVRECAKCKTTTTPLWRNGPKGAKITNGDKIFIEYHGCSIQQISNTTIKIHGTQLYISCWNTTATSFNSTSWLSVNDSGKADGFQKILPSRNCPPCGMVFVCQILARVPTPTPVVPTTLIIVIAAEAEEEEAKKCNFKRCSRQFLSVGVC